MQSSSPATNLVSGHRSPSRPIGSAPTAPFVVFAKDEVEQSIPARFEQQGRKYGDRLAVKTWRHERTYAALNWVANRVVHLILARQTRGEEQPVVPLLECRLKKSH